MLISFHFSLWGCYEGPIWATHIWYNPYGTHAEPGCTPHMGRPYGTHICMFAWIAGMHKLISLRDTQTSITKVPKFYVLSYIFYCTSNDQFFYKVFKSRPGISSRPQTCPGLENIPDGSFEHPKQKCQYQN